jgi:hypothetical protein
MSKGKGSVMMNNPAFDSSPIAEDDEYDHIKYQPTPHHLLPQVSETFPRMNSNALGGRRQSSRAFNVETESNIDKELGVGYAITPNKVPDIENAFNEIDEFLLDQEQADLIGPLLDGTQVDQFLQQPEPKSDLKNKKLSKEMQNELELQELEMFD